MVEKFVPGNPRAWSSNSARSYRAWREDVRKALEGEARVSPDFEVWLAFVLPSGAIDPLNLLNPYGADVDNLAKVVLDAMGRTILAPLGDGAVRKLHVEKREESANDPAGVHIRVKTLQQEQAG